MTCQVKLELPEPPAQVGGRSRHWRGKWAKVNAYKADVWAAAIQQVKPKRKPPSKVTVHLHYRLWNRRDPANLYADAKPLLDALKCKQSARDRGTWRNGLYVHHGYYTDDDELQFGSVTQEIDRENRGVTCIIEWEEPLVIEPSRSTGGRTE